MRFSSPPGLVHSHLPFLLSPSVLGVLLSLCLFPLWPPFSFPFLYQFVSFLLLTVLYSYPTSPTVHSHSFPSLPFHLDFLCP
ncbi:hypothetical protein F5H01DRAFT_117862 [Linnemannia elongata]|nr:hypothetical protein F5H01DRAFT_117862 [Linnemannia elongata]